MKDVIVVGCGIVGATIALALRKQGRDVMILDSCEKMAGTRPSGGHLKLSWFSGMSKTEYEPAMGLLEDIWGMEKSQFRIWPSKLKVTVYRIDTDIVLQTKYIQGRVSNLIYENTHAPTVFWRGSNGLVRERCRLLIVAAGVWCQELFPKLFPTKKELQAKQGVSFRFEGRVEAFIKPWAPYKQVVVHQQGPNEIWAGDGSAIIPQNWSEARTNQCLTRCHKALKIVGKAPLQVLIGLRAYCKVGKDPCLFRKIGPKAYLVTGAAKLGTIAAGWAAKRIVDVTT